MSNKLSPAQVAEAAELQSRRAYFLRAARNAQGAINVIRADQAAAKAEAARITARFHRGGDQAARISKYEQEIAEANEHLKALDAELAALVGNGDGQS